MTDQPASDGGHDPAQARSTRRRVRRTPNVVPFLLTGGIIGFVVGAIIGAVGDDAPTSHYSHTTSIGFIAFLFAALGVLLGAIAALIAEKVLTR